MAKTRITQAGLKKLKAELNRLIKIERPRVIARISAAREMGDLSENSDYDDARDEQSFLEGKIKELQNKISNAVIIKNGKQNGEVVLGSIVKVKNKNKEFVFELVDATEANPTKGKISDKSPIGSALMGAKKGDIVEFTTPAGTQSYKVLNID